MRKQGIVLLMVIFAAAMSISGCSGGKVSGNSGGAKALELTVVTSYGAEDGNRNNFEAGIIDWQVETGNKVINNSAMSNEEWKLKVNKDFETGNEPDVLFYFSGSDADNLINNGKVVPLAEIQAAYPDYGSNMNPDLLPASTADGKKYVIPTTGFWEALYVNKAVVEAAGLDSSTVGGADYTWDQFIMDCEAIKEAGYVPIAASLLEVPHYWWEYSVYNNGTASTHLDIPKSAEDETGKIWTTGLEDMKTMYEAGVFPENTLTAKDEETFQLMADNMAAFAIDGSWKMGWFMLNANFHLDDYFVTYVPAKGGEFRKSSDIIGGISMGYYITKKAWNNPAKREAAVSFVTHMTSDEVLAGFSNNGVVPTALKEAPTGVGETSEFVQSAIDMFGNQTGSADAVQDMLSGPARDAMLAGIKSVVTGTKPAEELVSDCIALNQ